MKRRRLVCGTIPAPLLIAAAMAVSMGAITDATGAAMLAAPEVSGSSRQVMRSAGPRESTESWMSCLQDVARRLQGAQHAVVESRQSTGQDLPRASSLLRWTPEAPFAAAASRVIQQHLNLPPPSIV